MYPQGSFDSQLIPSSRHIISIRSFHGVKITIRLVSAIDFGAFGFNLVTRNCVNLP